jgi:hypothetical protein
MSTYDASGMEEDVSFSRRELTPGVFELRAARGDRVIAERYRAFYPTAFGLDVLDISAMEEFLDEMIRRLSGDPEAEAAAVERRARKLNHFRERLGSDEFLETVEGTRVVDLYDLAMLGAWISTIRMEVSDLAGADATATIMDQVDGVLHRLRTLIGLAG